MNTRDLDAREIEQIGDIWRKASQTQSDLDKSNKALADCYMMARRQIARLERNLPADPITLVAWKEIVRFCENTGLKSSILREAVPTEITGG